MKAKEGVLELLNQVLRAELMAIHQYLLHAALCKNRGYERLHDHIAIWRTKKCTFCRADGPHLVLKRYAGGWAA